MTATQGRPGYRLKWSPEVQPAAGEQRAETDMSEPAEGMTGMAAAVDPAAPAEPSDQFLSSLTAAMRRVADDARETSLADARAAVAAKIAAMRDAAAARTEELRSRAEQDVTGIGDWSRAEIVRIEAETQRKIEHRRAQLAAQLDEHDLRSAAEIAGLEAQVEQYEGELALFFSQLGEITDPDTFISAARRMPRLPQANGVAAPEGAPAPTDEPAAAGHQEQLRSLGIDVNAERERADGEAPTNGVEPEAEADVVEAAEAAVGLDEARTEPPAASAPSAPAPDDDRPAFADAGAPSAATTVAAVGLGSFGAVTSFKTALERSDGVTSVRLSLGSGGEFMYTVTHHPDLDLAAVVSAAHPGASVQRSEDGVVRLNAGKRR